MSTTPPVPRSAPARPVLAQRHVARLLIGTLVGRLPTGMVPVALILLASGQGGSLTVGGLLCALYGLASALGQPLLGRLVDRRGQTLVTTLAVLTTTACLLLLPLLGFTAHPAYTAGLVVLAGLSTPPLEAGLRALWPVVLPDPVQQRAALALDTGSQGSIFVAGPPLAAALCATAGPTVTLVVSAGLGLLGAALVVTARPSRQWRPAPDAGTNGMLGPLRHRGLRSLFLALAGTGFALGALNVWAVSRASAYDLNMLTGVIPAALSVGSLLGGALYGRRTWPGSLAAQLTCAATAFAVAWLPLGLADGPLPAMLLPVLPGLFLTATITSAFLLVDALAPAGTLTEACAWLIAAVGVGQAAGTAVAGAAADQPFYAATLPAAGALATVSVLLIAHRSLAVPGWAPRRGRHRRVTPRTACL
ncbi:MFS transporter [Streptomyces sp. NPDC051561]|uniref:MFS transporter n=1 Tax=Streptomyces sp. NPDC051561 TaxID=3365658 RepID=UPI0037B16621